MLRPEARDARPRRALAAELKAHVQARLSKHKYPRWVVFVDDLPKNDRGKVDKKTLIEREKRGELAASDDREVPRAPHDRVASSTLVGGKRGVIALVPVGSTEPHGPHLGLGTDVVISAAACLRAVRAARQARHDGRRDRARDQLRRHRVRDRVLRRGLDPRARCSPRTSPRSCDGLLASGVRHVCLVNNHLEPAHDAAVRAVLAGREKKVSYACPLDEAVGAHAVGRVQERRVPRGPLRDLDHDGRRARARRRAAAHARCRRCRSASRRSSRRASTTFERDGHGARLRGRPGRRHRSRRASS